MVEYSKVYVILSNSQLDKLKTNKQKYQTNVTLTMNIKMFNENNLLYELLLTTRQKINQGTPLKIICQLM